MAEKELRFINIPSEQPLEVRDNKDGSATIVGYTAVYDEETQIGSGAYGFREVIRRGFFSRAINDRHDVRALFNHDSNNILGRSTAGTLQMREDERGLFVEIDSPDTQLGRDLTTSIRRGDVSGMSFAFTTKKVRWEENDGDEQDLRELLEIERLYDVGPVTYPAYEQTTANVRSGFRSNEATYREEHQVTTANSDVDVRWFPIGTSTGAGISPNFRQWTQGPVTIPCPTLRADFPLLENILAPKKDKIKEQEAEARERELELLELENM